MKTMILTDLALVKSSLAQTVITYVILGAALALVTGTPITAAACIGAMMTFTFGIAFSGSDELNGWQNFRAAMPISRRNTVLGRYASVLMVAAGSFLIASITALIVSGAASLLSVPGFTAADMANAGTTSGSVVAAAATGSFLVLWGISLMLPLIARYGLTKAARYVPVAFILGIVLVSVLLKDRLLESDLVISLSTWISTNPDAALVTLTAVILVATMVVYGISACIAVKLYERREL